MPRTRAVGCPEAVTRWPVPEERRTVTVLFADIVGSTGLVERLDPEDVRALQRAYFGTVSEVLRRWNGVVEKYVGDAVMALFGVHGSDGFDAYRAARAGLEIQDALDRRAPAGVRLRVRVGVATGEVLVDLAAARDGGHGSASGAVITTAARLQEYAPPGGVVVCAATHRAVAGLLDLRPLPTMAVAGKALPLDVWRVTGLARPGADRHDVPLVGRRRELADAADAIVRAVRDRRPRRVSLVGPAGSGRSRLLHELTRSVSTVDGTPVRWCVAYCPPYPRGELAPLADMVRAHAGIGDADSAAAARRRLATAVDGLLPPARRDAAAHALADFVAAPQDDGAAARGARVWREVLLALAATRPLVVAVDDLDRAGPALNRFLHRLVAAAAGRALPLAVVATHGPGRADLLPGAVTRRVPLLPLDAGEAGQLLRHLLDRAGRPAALVRELLPLVAGSPAAAQAYVRAVDSGGAVPDAVRRMVDARLDRLDGEQRAVLMAGAAYGVDFTAGTVEGLLDWPTGRATAALGALVAAGMLHRTGADRYAVAEPTVARVARHRLPRALRAEFARRSATRRLVSCPTGAGETRPALDAAHDADRAARSVRPVRPPQRGTAPGAGRGAGARGGGVRTRHPVRVDRPAGASPAMAGHRRRGGRAAPDPVPGGRPARGLDVVGAAAPRRAPVLEAVARPRIAGPPGGAAVTPGRRRPGPATPVVGARLDRPRDAGPPALVAA